MLYINSFFKKLILIFILCFLFSCKDSLNRKIINENNSSPSTEITKDNNVEKNIKKESDTLNRIEPIPETKRKIENINWIGTYIFKDDPNVIKLTVKPNNVVYYEGKDPFGSTHKFECYSVTKDNTLEIYFKKVVFDNISVKKMIKDDNEPLYILSYEDGDLYTQTQFDTGGIEEKYIYFIKQ